MNILEEIQNCPVEWKELGDKNVAKLSRGKVMSKQFLEENKGEYPVYSSQTANNGEIGRISSFEYDGEYITWTTDGANAGTVFYRKGKFSITNVCGLVEINSDQLLTKFVYYYLTISTKKYVSSGMGNPKLMSNVMGKIKIPILPLEIQEKIVQTLDKMTEYVTELTSELTSRNKQYSFYRDKLLSFEDEVYQVEWKELGEVVFTLTSPVKLAKKQYQLTGRIPIVDQGEQFIAGYTDNEKYLEKDEYIIFGDHSEHIKFVDFAFIQGADGLKILKPKKDINAKYLYYCVCNFYKKEGSYKRHWSNAKITLIPIPPLKIQEKVVQILDNFDKVCSDLNIGLPKEIELRQKQYEYWREQLLNFNK